MNADPSIPQILNTQDLSWESVVVDAFPGRGAVRRSLVEDDGISQEYLSGSLARTTVSLKPDGRSLTLSIGSANGSYRGMPSVRRWTVRLHLTKGSRPKAVRADGRSVPFRVLEPSTGRPSIPLLGKGSRPAPLSGPVVECELRLPVRNRTELRVDL